MRPVIRQLDEAAINRIAAGEVVERPASAVKELVENALDAGARRVAVDYAEGGKVLVRVTDDGCGMTAADLPLALSRHATSKTLGTDLLDIRSFGFRGEALPSLGAVGRLVIRSRAAGHDGAEIAVDGGRIGPVRPAAIARGTVVELRDLFVATPARLKFLRTDRAEAQAIAEVVRRLALCHPGVAFILREAGDDRVMLRADATDSLAERVACVLGRDFADNAVAVDQDRDGLRLTGLAGLPTFNRGNGTWVHVSVNGRPVTDRQLTGAVRAAYWDRLGRDRHPAAVLDVAVDPALVDVNVHPAKAEVRFRAPEAVRALVAGGLKAVLAGAGAGRTSSTLGAAAVGAMRGAARPAQASFARAFEMQAPGLAEAPAVFAAEGPLGRARGQVHDTYIIAETAEGMVIVDQHAAHERLVYEALKAQMDARAVAVQALLIPEIVDLPAPDRDRLLDAELAALGLEVEPFGPGAVAVRAVPAILGACDAGRLLRDVLDALRDGDGLALLARRDAVLSRMACHGSVRAGRALRPEEMDALLRRIEAVPAAAQCNHGRPTFIALGRADIERLFGRR